MKKFLLILFLLILFILNVKSQDNSFNPSVLQQYPYYPPSTTLNSSVVTVNGFDNFYLGIDFGEPYIATNPRDLLNSICAFNINNLYYTLDGINWIKNNPVFSGFSVLGDPVMTYDSLGTCYYMQLYQNGATYGLATVKSTNKGVTWINPTNVFSTTVGLADKEWITAVQTGGPYTNYLYAGWRQFGSTNMRFVRSTDLGATWSAPLTFAGGQGAYVSVGPNGSIQGGRVYFANTLGDAIAVVTSTDGGVNFAPQVLAVTGIPLPGNPCAGRQTVKNCIRMDNMPRMAADNSYGPHRGNCYIVYAANPAGADITDILLIRSTNGGVNWSSPIRVNDDATTTDQWLPTISVDNVTGRIFISWFDSRTDPGANLMTDMYGTTSTDGGLTFTTNQRISNVSFNPDNMRVGQPGGHNYIGDYIGVSAIRNTGYNVWMDARNSSLGSYTGYYPDYAMTVNPSTRSIGNNDSTTYVVGIPAVRGPYSGTVKFTATLDTLPLSGTINLSFVNGRDSITSFPDSVTLRVRTIGTVTPRLYRVTIRGKGPNGVPVHDRVVDVLVNSSYVTFQTNRPGVCQYRVNGFTYTNNTTLAFANGSSVQIQAVSPLVIGSTRYMFVNWSDGGDTTHNITVNGPASYTATFKTQFRLTLISDFGTTSGGNAFYDSAGNCSFAVLQRIAGGNRFRGWDGSGPGSYTSADSSGNDTAVTIQMRGPCVETARWIPIIGIHNLSNEIPKEYKLYQNYPNPFNPATNVKFDIIKTGLVRITIYDILGRVVDVPFSEILAPGRFRFDYDASRFASGVYYYKIESGEFTDIKKMILLK